MKEKVAIAAIAIMVLASTMLTIIPTFGQPVLKIGVIGPVGLPHWSPAGMLEASEIAAQQINDAGGINIGGTSYTIELVFENEYATTLDIAAAQQAVQNLYDAGCRIMIGGFRTEVTIPMIEKAMTQAEPVIFLVNGASTDEIISTTVPLDYEKYKYLFRINPVNSTMLFTTIAGGVQALIAKLLPVYGFYNADLDRNQLRVAVVTEDLTWTATIHQYLSNPAIYPAVLGPSVNVTYQARIPETAVDLSSYAGEIIASKARIIIHVFSGRVGAYFAGTWGQAQIKAIPVGINVLAQLQQYWTDTGGFCEYESFLNFVGTDTPINAEAQQFWADFTAYTGGVWPIYTAYGAYNGLYIVKEALESAGTTDADDVVSALETLDIQGLTGRFKFTAGTGSLIPQITSVPHDLYTVSFGPTWPEPQYGRAFIVQWQAGRMEVVSPMDQPYSKAWAMPPWMRPIIADLDLNGRVDILDIAKAAIAFGSYPGHERWDIETDIDGNAEINIIDIAQIAMRFGETVELPIED